MSFTVKLAVFPARKAPIPYETLAGTFATLENACEAGRLALTAVTEKELSAIAPNLEPCFQKFSNGHMAAIKVPPGEVSGYLVLDEKGVEVANWTTLDKGVARVASDQTGEGNEDPTDIRLGRLRQIAWDEWDPIGIRCADHEAWRTAAAGEYDSYMLQVASILSSGGSTDEAVRYLDEIVTDHMALGPTTEAQRQSSRNTVEAVAAYLSETLNE
ncbi:hypothetical protein FG93_00966 [Bosea sp. LC85]|uniref:hypothetical protein n=1 Tax=Bosea sp. LC85 TaxID=1502851 RepID=UPI0004E45295|nr:hypothetical protein [Bosea sp. LC85]KFC74787.1 hypothetical protein FG93_00966 [Bosea sp. LC85]